MKLMVFVLSASWTLAPAEAQVQAQAPPPARSRSASNLVMIRNSGSYLGIAFVEIDAERAKVLKLKDEHGVEVKVVDQGSPAARAGLKPDDVVVEFGGQRVEGVPQFTRMVLSTPAGRKVGLSVIREGAPVALIATLEPRVNMREPLVNFPPLPPMPPIMMPDLPRAVMFWRIGLLGIESETLNSQLAEYFGVKAGVLVRMVNRESPAEKCGLRAGDVIVKAGGKPVAATQELSAMLRDQKTITLGVVRNRKEMSVEVTAGHAR
jgi:serine protease Do